MTHQVDRFASKTQQMRTKARIALAARRVGSTVELELASSARLGKVDVRIAPGTHNVLSLGEHTVLDDGVEIRLDGGEVRLADWVEVRRGVRLMVSGHLSAQGENLLSWGVVIHCSDAVTLERQAVLAEYVTIVDSVHEHVDGAWHLDHLTSAPVRVGTDTWVGAKATITKGVTIGERCVVAGSAVVIRDVADRHLAAGVPAVCRPLPPPRAAG